MEAAQERLSHAERLTSASVCGARVGRVDVAQLEAAYPALTDVDLSRNALCAPPPLPSSWRSVNLAHNPLYVEPAAPAWPHLRTVALAHCGLTWVSLLALLRGATALTTLDASGSALADVPAELGRVAAQLEHLYLCECGVERWAQLAPVAVLPRLTHLYVAHNAALATLRVEEGHFAALELLSVAHTALPLEAVCALAPVRTLRKLRYAGTPAHEAHHSRLIVVGGTARVCVYV